MSLCDCQRRKKKNEKQTHRLFSIHGLHPQLPVPLWESLESDGHISTETVTDTIPVLQLNDWVSMCTPVPFQHPTSLKQNKRITTWAKEQQEQRLRASLKYLIKSHVWKGRNKCDEMMMTFNCCNLTVGDATELDAKVCSSKANKLIVYWYNMCYELWALCQVH